jgi:hypothetical protein
VAATAATAVVDQQRKTRHAIPQVSVPDIGIFEGRARHVDEVSAYRGVEEVQELDQVFALVIVFVEWVIEGRQAVVDVGSLVVVKLQVVRRRSGIVSRPDDVVRHAWPLRLGKIMPDLGGCPG